MIIDHDRKLAHEKTDVRKDATETGKTRKRIQIKEVSRVVDESDESKDKTVEANDNDANPKDKESEHKENENQDPKDSSCSNDSGGSQEGMYTVIYYTILVENMFYYLLNKYTNLKEW